MNDPLMDAIHKHEPLEDPLEEINLRLAIAATDIADLRAEVARLDRDLDESRRLNLRAVELLDLVYGHLAGTPGCLEERTADALLRGYESRLPGA
jgi:hypothetical protein